jgi:hypothetical protein
MSKEETSGRSRGGMARAESLSDDERESIAKKAAVARWGPKATHKGNFEKEFGIDVDCYVLNDDMKTAVISQRGMGEALGLGKGGSRLPNFISRSNIAPYLGQELSEKLQNPLIFQGFPVGINNPLQRTYGFDVTILIDICKAVIKAEADEQLTRRQAQTVARQAHVIVNASAKAGIKGLVYALAGFDPTREDVIAAFKLFVREEAREYEKEFPDQLYKEWYRLYQIPVPQRNKPWKFKHLTTNQVYHPLAKSKGRILRLTKDARASSESKSNRLHQFLSEIGVKILRTHLGQLLGIAQVSKNKDEYEKHILTIFGDPADDPAQGKLF